MTAGLVFSWDVRPETCCAAVRFFVLTGAVLRLAGAFFVAQSGQPWEEWSFEPYRALTTSTSETNRYAEKAGLRRSPAHWQLDLNYTQDIRLASRVNLQLAADLFNVFNEQTGYNFEPRRSFAAFGRPRNYYDPRRLQVAARLQF